MELLSNLTIAKSLYANYFNNPKYFYHTEGEYIVITEVTTNYTDFTFQLIKKFKMSNPTDTYIHTHYDGRFVKLYMIEEPGIQKISHNQLTKFIWKVNLMLLL